jgi:hypothetical protein
MITSNDKINDNLQPKSTGGSSESEMVNSSSENGNQRKWRQWTKVSDNEVAMRQENPIKRIGECRQGFQQMSMTEWESGMSNNVRCGNGRNGKLVTK